MGFEPMPDNANYQSPSSLTPTDLFNHLSTYANYVDTIFKELIVPRGGFEPPTL